MVLRKQLNRNEDMIADGNRNNEKKNDFIQLIFLLVGVGGGGNSRLLTFNAHTNTHEIEEKVKNNTTRKKNNNNVTTTQFWRCNLTILKLI